MASLAFTLGGAALGSATLGTAPILLGLTGANIGAAVGGIAASYLLAPKVPDQIGPNFADGRVTSSAYGQMIPLVWGTMPVAGNIIDASTIDAIPSTSGGGGKGAPSSPKVTTFTHYADIDVLVCDATFGPVSLLQIYANEVLIYDGTAGATVSQPAWLWFEWFDGTQTQPSPTFEAIRGAGNVPIYKDMAHIVFKRFKLDEFGLSDQIAIQFRFVVSKDGTSSATEETIDTTDYESTSSKIIEIGWAKYPDLMLVGLETTASAAVPVKTLLGVDPYSRSVVWTRNYPSGQDDQKLLEMVPCSIPISSFGVQLNVPGAQVVYTLTHSGTNNERIEVADVDTGVVRVRTTTADQYAPYWLCAPDQSQMTLYRHLQTALGSGGIYRMAWNGSNYADTFTGNPWSETAVAAPSGWKWGSTVRPATDGNGVVCFPLIPATTGAPSVLVIDDGELAAFGTVTAAGYTPTTLSTLDEVIACMYDITQDCFWVIGERSADANMQMIKIDTDGDILDQWDMNTDLGIAGLPSWADMLPGVDDTAGRIVFGISSNYYSVSTTDPSVGIRSYAMPSTTIGVGAMHPVTGRFYTANDEILHIVRLNTVAEGTSSLEDVMDDICLAGDTHLTGSDVDNSALSAITVKGFSIARSGMAKSAAINMLAAAYLFDLVPRDGVLTAILRGTGSSAITLDDDTIGAHVSGGTPPSPFIIRKAQPETLPRALSIQYVNPDQNWEQGSQTAQRLASIDGVGTAEQIPLAVSMSDSDAAKLADILLHLRHIEGERYETATMPSTMGDVQPANIVTVSYDDNEYVTRVDSADIVDGMVVEANLVRHDASIYGSYAVGGTVRNAARDVYSIGSAIAIPMQLPALRSEDFDAGYYMAVYSHTPSWPGAELFRSIDGSTYASVANARTGATVGIVRSISDTLLPLVWDAQTAITINLIAGSSLSSESLANVEADRTLNTFAIGAPGRWVIGKFLTATQNSDDTWAIENMALGLSGTEQHVENLVANDKLVMLSTASIARVVLSTESVGGTDYIKPVTLGRNIDDVVAVTLSPAGSALECYAPHNLHASGFGGDITLSWTRRDKQWTRPFWAAPMTESAESYTIDILDSDGEVVRTLTSSSESATYTSAQQTTDFGAGINYVRWRVAQVSANVGSGGYATTASGKRISWENHVLSYSPLLFLQLNDAVDSSTVVDSSSYGSDGTISGSGTNAVLGVDGAFETGINMSEDDSGGVNINVGSDSSLLNIVASDFTVIFWIKRKSGQLTSKLGSVINQDTGIDIYFSDAGSGVPELNTRVDYTTTDARFYSTDFSIVVGTWHMFAVTHDSTAKTSKIYFDGSEVGSYTNNTTGVGTSVVATADTVIGSTATLSYFDDITILPSELSGSQIADAYAKSAE